MSDEADAIAGVVTTLRGDDELDALAARLSTKRLVLLGEASHGTHEFYDLRAALTRRLIGRYAFAGVAVEGDWPDAMRVDRFVRGAETRDDDESATAALGSFTRFPRWMWRNADVASFVAWLRRADTPRPPERRAGFYGLDLYSLRASISAVLSYLGTADPEAAARARERYACFDHVRDARAALGLAPDCEEAVVAQLVEMQRRYATRAGRSPSGDAWFHAMADAHVVRDAEAYYRAMLGRGAESWNLRDTHMADMLDMLATHLGAPEAPAKLVVWAHNSHVGDARATELGEDDHQLTLGQLVRERHPGETALVGFTTYDGRVIAAHDWDEPYARELVRPALGGSWEALFHATGVPRFGCATDALVGVVGREEERLQRAIGVVYRPETERRSHYFHARLLDEFDYLVHVDRTRALEPLDPPAALPHPANTDADETFPTGM
jgi:erythromycin esterase-like protein